VVDPERGETGGNGRVGEAVDEAELIVEHVDSAEAEARRVDELAAARSGYEGEALVIGADVAGGVRRRRVVDGNHRVRGIDVRVPPGDRAVLGREEEEGRTGDTVLLDHEVRRAVAERVEGLTRRCTDRSG